MSIHGDDAYDLGHTAAGWTGAAVAALGCGLCALGVITTWKALVFAGSGVLVLALLIAWALHLAGWGKPSGPRPVEQWDWRARDTSAREGHPDCLGCRLAGRQGARRTHSTAAVEPAESDFQIPDSTLA